MPIPAPSLKNSAQPALALGLLLALTAFAYWPSLNFGFTWDDHPLIVENSRIGPGSSPLSAFKVHFWDLGGRTDRLRRFFRPLVTVSYWLSLRLFGGDTRPFHASNLLLHLACVALAFELARRFLGAWLPALGAALVFALHPTHVENVAWISGRTDLMAALFGLGGLLLWLESEARESRAWAALGCFCFGLALLSKETAIMAGPAWLFFRSPDPESPGKLIYFNPWRKRVLAWCALVALAVGVARLAAIGVEAAPAGPGPLVFASALGWAGAAYLGLALLLKGTDPHHFDLQFAALEGPWLTAGLLLLALGCGLAWWLLRRGGPAARALALSLLFLLPVAALGSFGDVLYADRFLYLPSLGLGLLAGLGLKRLRTAPIQAGTLAAAALLMFLPLTRGLAIWQDDVTLFEAATRTSPRSSLVLNNLGLAYSKAGRWGEAEQILRRALQVDPHYGYARHNLALALRNQGRIADALVEFEKAGKLDPLDPLYAFNKADALAALGLSTQAEASLRRALALRPDYGEASHNLGQLLLARGDAKGWGEARSRLMDGVRLGARPARSLNSLGVLSAKQGDLAAARGWFQRALELEADYAPARDNLARLEAGGR